MVGALKLARTLKKGSIVVTILCDHGMRYQSKLFNYDFLKQKELPVPFWMEKGRLELPNVMREEK